MTGALSTAYTHPRIQVPVMAGETDDVREWLRDTRLARGLKQEEVEKATAELGAEFRVSQSYLSKIERGFRSLRSLGPERMDALRQVLGVSPLEWVTRTGYQLVIQADHTEGVNVHGITDDMDYVNKQGEERVTPIGVHLEPVRALATAGRPFDEAEEILGYFPVPADLWRPGMQVFRAEGHSMHSADRRRSIDPGDILFVDSHELDLREDKVYVIRIIGDGVCVKRVRTIRGQVWLVSQNDEFEPFQPDEAEIVGRVYHRLPKGDEF